MPQIDEHHAYYKALMILIGGGPPRSGQFERWLERVHLRTGVTPEERVGKSSLIACWRGKWISSGRFVSRKTHERLEEAGAHARRTKDTVEFLELQIAIWETRPDLFQQDIEEARDFVSRLRRINIRRDEDRASAPAVGFASTAKA